MADESTAVNVGDESTVENVADESTVENMADESPKETSEDQCTPYAGNVYAATPSSGSGGGDDDNDEEDGTQDQDQVDAHQTQQMESIYNYLQDAPTEDSTKKVSDWVNSVEDIGNSTVGEGDGLSQQQCEQMEEDERENSQAKGDGTDDINKDETPGETTFKIFVSNLPPGFLDSELKDLFEKFGEVAECEIFAKSYAFVHMTSEESAAKAMEELNGLDLRGCKINVKRSVQSSHPIKPKKVKEEPETGLEVGTYKIYIGNLKSEVTQEYVSKLLEPYGRTVEVEIYRNTSAFVHMETEEGGKKAIEELNGQTLPDSDAEKPLIVSESKNPEGPNLATIKLKVWNLSPKVKADALRSLFTPYGLVLKVNVATKKRANPDACRSGVVHLEQFGNIRSAIKELNGKEIEGSAIHVEPLFDKPEPPKPKNKQASFSRPSHKPEHEGWVPSSYEKSDDWYTPNPNKMRLIPMPSQSELHQFPRSSKGRRLIRGPPPPPLMGQAPFTLPPFQTQGYDNFSGYNNDYEQGYNEAIDDGFGGGYANYDESQDYNPWNEDWNQYTDGNDYTSPPQKMPRNKSWNDSRGFGGGGGGMGGRAPQNGKAQFGKGKQNNTNFNKNNSNNRGLFPQLPSADQFPKAKKPSFALQSQIPQSDNTDWSSDYPISGFSQFSNNQDFTSDELAIDDTHAVPFDYSQMQKRKYAGDRNARQQNANVYQGNRGGGGGGASWGSKSGKGRGKGKARRPGLGTSQQQKKAAQQTGSDTYDDSSTQPGEWQPSNPNQMRLIPMPSEADLQRTSSNNSNARAGGSGSEAASSTYAPYYFQQNWSFSKGKQNKKATAKQIKEAEEEQKRQYAEYLKQKPWLYQAIPGTVKKVQQ